MQRLVMLIRISPVENLSEFHSERNSELIDIVSGFMLDRLQCIDSAHASELSKAIPEWNFITRLTNSFEECLGNSQDFPIAFVNHHPAHERLGRQNDVGRQEAKPDRVRHLFQFGFFVHDFLSRH